MELTKEQKILQQVLSEAWSNPTFKQELIASPEAAIKKLTGEFFELPEGKRLQVFDQSDADVICLNIPQQPTMDNVELTDDELELVAGGFIMPLLQKKGVVCLYPALPRKGGAVSQPYTLGVAKK